MRKDLKKAVEHIDISLKHIKKVSESDTTPSDIKNRVHEVVDSLENEKEVLEKVRSIHVV